VPAFVRLLSSPNEDVREQAVWALGNIAGDGVATRDLVISAGIVEPLLRAITPGAKDTFIRNAAWTLSNLCRGKPLPDIRLVAPLLPKLSALITSTDRETLADSLWALSYLSDGDEERLQAFLEAGAVVRVVELLDNPSHEVLTPALRTIGNIVTGDELQTQTVLNEGALAPVARLLQMPRKGIRKEACWLVSNVCAGSMPQIQSVIDANIIPLLIQLMSRAEPEVSREACWALSNATTGGNSVQVAHLVNFGIIPPLKDMLTRNDGRVQVVAIEGLENILRHVPPPSANGLTSYKQFMEEAGVPQALDDLLGQHTTSTAAYTKAESFLKKYFSDYLADGIEEDGEIDTQYDGYDDQGGFAEGPGEYGGIGGGMPAPAGRADGDSGSASIHWSQAHQGGANNFSGLNFR
jgi:hypothetical protein